MNREILFKAKRTDNGEWVEGYYVKYQPCASRPEYVHGIVPTYASALYMIKIDPDTLCQYTGLTTRTVRKFGRMILFYFMKKFKTTNGKQQLNLEIQIGNIIGVGNLCRLEDAI